MSFYSIVKTTYKKVLPNTVRRLIYRYAPKPLKMVKAYVIRKFEKSAEFDEIYDEKYYTDILDRRLEKSFEVIGESILKVFSPESVVDVGCGIGLLLFWRKKSEELFAADSSIHLQP